MIGCVVLALILVVCEARVKMANNDIVDLRHKFSNFMSEFKKTYSASEYDFRFKAFLRNYEAASELAKANPSASLDLEKNPFADITPEEFRTRLLPRVKVPPLSKDPVAVSSQLQAPSEYDWTQHGAVTQVKDQGTLGTCWAFSTIENLEGQLFIKHGTLRNLSVEQLVECDAHVNGSDADCGFFGGWPYVAFEYLTKAGGVRSQEQMPYCSGATDPGVKQCYPCMASGYNKDLCGDHGDLWCNATSTLGQGPEGLCRSTQGVVAQVNGWSAITENEADIVTQLVSIGPLSVLMDASSLQYYKSGIWEGSTWVCSKTDLDHAVLLVGYGTDNGKDYWKVKNSWGEKWGEKGYFRIRRGTGACGINTRVTSGIIV